MVYYFLIVVVIMGNKWIGVNFFNIGVFVVIVEVGLCMGLFSVLLIIFFLVRK